MPFLYRSLLFAAFLSVTSPALATNVCDSQNFSDCLDGVGPAVTNPDTLRITLSHITNQTNQHADEDNGDTTVFFGSSLLSGIAAGDGFNNWGLWGSFSYSNFSADIPIASLVQPIASYDADQNNFFMGADTLIKERIVLGLTIGYENTDIDTAYNGGNSDTDGYTIAPYAAYLINDVLSVDVVGGYTSLNTDTDRIDTQTGGTIIGEFDADRWFVATNINANISRGQWLFGGRIGYLYTEEDQDAYIETGGPDFRSVDDRHIDLSQASFSLDAAYMLNQFEPYTRIVYVNDFGRDNGTDAGGLPGSVGATQPDDDDEFQFGLGFRYFGEIISATFEWSHVLDRDTFDGDTVMFTLRADL